MKRAATILAAAFLVATVSVEAAPTARFRALDGRYRGHYTTANHGPVGLRLEVGPLNDRLHGVKLLKWSGKIRCPGHRTQVVSMEMAAADIGRTFSGYMFMHGEKQPSQAFTGSFTAKDALEATVRVRRGSGTHKCDTGPLRFVAHRVRP
jgi:hypothetical protein